MLRRPTTSGCVIPATCFRPTAPSWTAGPAALRARYSRTTYGQGCLLARRLVEAGVRFVTVYFAPNIGGQAFSGGWDTHGFNNHSMYPILNNYLFPLADKTLPTLLED